MLVTKHYPSPKLQAYINHYWRMEGKVSDAIKSRDIPDGNIEVILNFGSPFLKHEGKSKPTIYKTGGIKGQFDHSVIIEQSGEVDIIGISFKPWGLHPFLKESISAITNIAAPPELLVNSELESKLYDQIDSNNWISVLNDSLFQMLDVNYAVSPVLEESVSLLSNKGNVRIREMCKNLDVNIKYLERLYLERIGLTPKQFHRIRRLRNLVNMITKSEYDSWIELVVAFDFHDQSHFTKEFVTLTGKTPTGFARGADTFSSHYSYN